MFDSPVQKIPAASQTQTSNHRAPNHSTGNSTGQSPAADDLIRVFNSAIVATRASDMREFSSELMSVVDSPAFRAILGATRQLSRQQGISEKQAAEQVIQAFRKLDRVWGDYVFQEGVDRIRNKVTS